MNNPTKLPSSLPIKSYNRKIKRSFSIEAFEVPSKTDGCCRICLQTCPYLQLCNCRGSSMLHVDCLKQYIAKGHGSVKNRSKCQICGKPFNLLFTKKCTISCDNVLKYFKTSPLFSILFLLFSLLTIAYIGYCSYVNDKGQLDDNLQLVLLIIGICMVLVLVIVLLRWMYIYFFVTMNILVDILPAEVGVAQLTKQNLNQSQQHLK